MEATPFASAAPPKRHGAPPLALAPAPGARYPLAAPPSELPLPRERRWMTGVLAGATVCLALAGTAWPGAPAQALRALPLRPSPALGLSWSHLNTPLRPSTALAVVAPSDRPTGPVRVPEAPTLGPHARPPAKADTEPNWGLLLGHVLDTLMNDYPRILVHEPNLEVYHPEVEVWDEGSRLLKGRSNYRMLFQVLRSFPMAMGWRPQVTARYTVDSGLREVKVRWHVKMNPLNPSPLMVDGISTYKVDRDGLIYEHRLHFVTTSFITSRMQPVFDRFLSVEFCPQRSTMEGRPDLGAWVKEVVAAGQALWQPRPPRTAPLHLGPPLRLLPAPAPRMPMRVVDSAGAELAVDRFSLNSDGARSTAGKSVWQALTEKIPPKFCDNKYDCEYQKGARCCDFLFVWSCCYPNEEDWPPSGGIGIPVVDPIPIEVRKGDPYSATQLPAPHHARHLLGVAPEAALGPELVTQYHPSPLTELAALLSNCTL